MAQWFDVLIDAGFYRKAAEAQSQARGNRVPASRVRLNAAAARTQLEALAEHEALAGRRLRDVLFYEAALSFGIAGRIAAHFRQLDEDLRARGSTGLPRELLERIDKGGEAYKRTIEDVKRQQSYFKALAHRGVTVREGNLRFRPWALTGSLKNAVRALAESEEFLELGVELQLETLLAVQDAQSPRREQKGVDTMLALDLVRLASAPEDVALLLMTGDSDFCPAVDAARELQDEVLLLTAPEDAGRMGVHTTLRSKVAGEVRFDPDAFSRTYAYRPPRS